MIVAGLASLALAQDPQATLPSLDSQTSVAFGDALLHDGDPFNALTAYRLALFLSPDRPDAPELRFRVALCYELGDRFDAATASWLDLAGRHSDWSTQATYRAAMTLLEGGHFDEAQLYLDEVASEGTGTPWAERAAFMKGEAAMEAGRSDQANAALESFKTAFPASELLPRAVAADRVLDQHVRHVSPALAATMSTVLPGSGQIYAGHTGDGVMAFIANGTLGYWSYALLRQGVEQDRGWEVTAGGVIGFMAVTSWTSNVIGSAMGAKRTNTLARKERLDAAMREADNALLERDAEDVALP